MFIFFTKLIIRTDLLLCTLPKMCIAVIHCEITEELKFVCLSENESKDRLLAFILDFLVFYLVLAFSLLFWLFKLTFLILSIHLKFIALSFGSK